jgi:hypothetical protein
MKYWWPFIISASLYGCYQIFKLWGEYPNEIDWGKDNEADDDEM